MLISKKIAVAAIGLSSLLCNAVYAEGSYFGGNASFVKYSDDVIGEDASLTAVFGRLGTMFNENISGEIRVGFGIADDTVLDVVDVELDNLFGAYVRGGIPVADAFYPYAIIGYTRGKLSASVSGFGSESGTESDISFGVGADFDVASNITLNAEYMNFLDKDGAEISGFSFGLASKF
jgi:outer membrane immunogenic protein